MASVAPPITIVSPGRIARAAMSEASEPDEADRAWRSSAGRAGSRAAPVTAIEINRNGMRLIARRPPSAPPAGAAIRVERRAVAGCGLATRSRDRSPPGPSDRAAYARAATAPPSAATRARRDELLELGRTCRRGRPARAAPPASSRNSPIPMRTTSRPVATGTTARAARANPAAWRLDGAERRRAEPVGPQPDDERGPGEERFGRPARASSRRSSRRRATAIHSR